MTKTLALAWLLLISSSALAQDLSLWLHPPTSTDNSNNNNQYQCPLWTKRFPFYDEALVRGENEWIDVPNLIVRDFNLDGYCDVFISFFSAETSHVPFKLYLYSATTGTFEERTNLITNNAGQPFTRKAVSADLNQDGILDFIAVSHPEGESERYSYLDIVLSNNTGWVQENVITADRFNQEGYFHGVAAGDIDNDGDVDLLIADSATAAGVFALLNAGNGEFTRSITTLDESLVDYPLAYTIEVHDIDKDGCADLIYGYGGDHLGAIAYGNCSGNFGTRHQFLERSLDLASLYSLTALIMDFNFSDFDYDGDEDLITVVTDYVTTWRLMFHENIGKDATGRVIFDDVSTVFNNDLLAVDFYLDESSRYWPRYIEFSDINRDGLSDIVQPNFFIGTSDPNDNPPNWVLLGSPDGSFEYANYPIASTISDLSGVQSGKHIEIGFNVDIYGFEAPDIGHFDENALLESGIHEWVVYYSDEPFFKKDSNGVYRASYPSGLVTMESLAPPVEHVTLPLHPLLSSLAGHLYFRIAYKDEHGLEFPFSDIATVVIDHIPAEASPSPHWNNQILNTLSLGGTTFPDASSAGTFSLFDNAFFSCMKVLEAESAIDTGANLMYSIKFVALEGSSDLFRIVSMEAFNPMNLVDHTGQVPPCSGTYLVSSGIYRDVIRIGNIATPVHYRIVSTDPVEMKLLATNREELLGVKHSGPGAVLPSSAQFAIGMSLDSGLTFVDAAVVSEQVEITGVIRPETGHIGQAVDIFIVDRVNLTSFLMRNQNGAFIPWNGNVADLIPNLEGVLLTDELVIEIHDGLLAVPGDHRLFIGYIPDDGVLRYTPFAHRISIYE